MFHATLTRLAWAACSAVLVAFSTGCMIQPGHERQISSRDSVIQFMGASTRPDSRIEIQVFHPTLGWQRLGETMPEFPYRDHNGDWYIWFADLQVPEECWEPAVYRYSARLRAVNLADGSPLYTFDRFFPWYNFVRPIGPEYMTMNVAEMFQRWGHGTEVTVYANDLPAAIERRE